MEAVCIFTVAVLNLVMAGGTCAEPRKTRRQSRRQVERTILKFGDFETKKGVVVVVVLRDATDKDLDVLMHVTKLQILDIGYCKTTGRCLRHIAQMKQLRRLWLHNNKISDCSLGHIVGLKKLSLVDLEDTPVTDNGMRHIAKCSSLMELVLKGTEITDRSVEHLSKLKRLQRLDVTGTKLTSRGIAALKAALPKVKIVH